MSSTNRGKTRNQDDFYETPAWATQLLLKHCSFLDLAKDGIWCEPAAGRGAIIKAVEDWGYHPTWHAVEIDAERRKSVKHLDIPRERLHVDGMQIYQMWTPPPRIDVIITNPPYSVAEEFIRRAVTQAPIVAMLLRLNFLGSDGRKSLFKMWKPDLFQINPRPFADSCEYAWFVSSGFGGGRWERIDAIL